MSSPLRYSISRTFLCSAAVLLLAVVFAYLPVWHAGFIWDDDTHVTANPCIVGPLGFKDIWTSPAGFYFPLTTTSFWLLHAIWGLNPLPYHVVSILVHGLNAILLWRVLCRLGVPGAWLGAMLWALHPVQVESVAWIAELKNTQSGLFYLLTIWLFLNWVESRESPDLPTKRRRPGYFYALALLGSGAAIFSKSSTVMLPVVLGLCWWWQTKSWRWRQTFWLLPFAAISAAASLWTIWEQKFHSGALGADWSQNGFERLIIAGKDIWFYLGKLVWPYPLIFIYPRWAPNSGQFTSYLPAIAAIVVLAVLWHWRRRTRPVLFAALYFGVSLFPVLDFFDVYFFRYSFVGDHFQYLASMGMLALAGAGIATVAARIGASGLRTAIYAAPVIALGCLTWRQSGIYGDLMGFYRTIIHLNPACSMAHNNLAMELEKSPGQMIEARKNYEIAVQLDPGNAEAHNNLAGLLANVPGQAPAAIEHYEAALRLRPDLVHAHVNLASLLAAVPDRIPDALAHYEMALRLDPDNAEAHNNLATVLADLPGRAPEAILHYEAALKSRPDLVDTQLNLASLLAATPGREAEAVAHYQAALRLQPQNAEAHNNLAALLATLPGRMPEAIAQFEEAVRLHPDFADAHFNLADLLAAIPGREAEAVAHYDAALRIRPNDAEAHYRIANLLAKLPGDEAPAEAHYREAIRLRPDYAEAYDKLGLLCLRLRRKDEARRCWEQAIKAAPDFPDPRRNLELLRKG